ncbi:hypothetical protein DFJ74DRAFT_660230 [Hyaloraphidium curvatum]|nr:hypothetical protein DFJ74DRAFT_660230 [Hyaloraphidium curvatum]
MVVRGDRDGNELRDLVLAVRAGDGESPHKHIVRPRRCRTPLGRRAAPCVQHRAGGDAVLFQGSRVHELGMAPRFGEEGEGRHACLPPMRNKDLDVRQGIIWPHGEAQGRCALVRRRHDVDLEDVVVLQAREGSVQVVLGTRERRIGCTRAVRLAGRRAAKVGLDPLVPAPWARVRRRYAPGEPLVRARRFQVGLVGTAVVVAAAVVAAAVARRVPGASRVTLDGEKTTVETESSSGEHEEYAFLASQPVPQARRGRVDQAEQLEGVGRGRARRWSLRRRKGGFAGRWRRWRGQRSCGCRRPRAGHEEAGVLSSRVGDDVEEAEYAEADGKNEHGRECGEEELPGRLGGARDGGPVHALQQDGAEDHEGAGDGRGRDVSSCTTRPVAGRPAVAPPTRSRPLAGRKPRAVLQVGQPGVRVGLHRVDLVPGDSLYSPATGIELLQPRLPRGLAALALDGLAPLVAPYAKLPPEKVDARRRVGRFKFLHATGRSAGNNSRETVLVDHLRLGRLLGGSHHGALQVAGHEAPPGPSRLAGHQLPEVGEHLGPIATPVAMFAAVTEHLSHSQRP